jgi:hypothetical protein
MRKLILVMGIVVIAATAMAWSNIDRQGVTKAEMSTSAPINPNEMTIQQTNTLAFEYWGAF